ncbi:membrane-bound lytic murein transglycosylase D [Lewinella aquimaris]|uniref:Membrane-bound lytic murein transglycosylase D n=1 Tax=Neolewinella aquimaris TaxID=1835722 RepID=A0A840E963_9BACT|nr:lytic transglycosylase domain-containing protein [Neolewinella aquimaris]MBB4080262.1 membrane-bound lytic murein transglycosylase D [Neolewinella aquimaris]
MPYCLRIFFLLLLCFPLRISALDSADAERQARIVMELSREEVEARLSAFDQSLVDYQVDDAVYRRVVNYLRHWPISSGRMLARSARFYPIFEEQLVAAGLPLELKHLSIVESALRSWAVSPVGAGGLWQLMPGTARELGLTVNDELDERLDPTLGCAAGLEYLRIQYERYGDWALALAAYNSGPGNVNRAIRRSGSRNYWKLRRFLPRETRDYVPNFIAAIFLMSYHHHYGLPATQISLDGQLTERIPVERRLSLYRVAQVTGLRPDVVIELNPQYLRGYLPGLRGGHYLQLPRRVVPAMLEYLALHPSNEREDAIALPWSDPLLAAGEINADRYYQRYEIVVEVGDTTARQVADRHELPVDRLLVWSDRGEVDTLSAGELLYYYDVDVYHPYDPRTREPGPPAPQLAVHAPPGIHKSLRTYFAPLPDPTIRLHREPAKKWWQLLFK